MKGQCLCKAVTLEVIDNHELHACHCHNCRTWGGGALFTVETHAMQIDGQDNISSYQSSDWATRHFCTTCGTHLYAHVLGTDDYYISAGLFDDVDFKLTSQIFIDKKACYYELANDTPKLTESEFIAMLTDGCK